MTSEQTPGPSSIAALASALAQTSRVLAHVRDEHLDAPTPCAEWSVQALVDHLVVTPGHFTQMMRGERPDFAAVPPHVGADREQRFHAAADTLLGQWREQGDAAQASMDMQLAELAVHTWDLATATGQSTIDLDPEVARRGLGFMQANLKDEHRGDAFGPAQVAPADAGPYAQIAAFAGRSI